MKLLINILTLLTSFAAFANPADTFQSGCESEEAKKLQGQNGSCRVVVNPKPLKVKGFCQGDVLESLPCTITFDSATKSSHITCGDDPSEPRVDSDLSAEFTEYRVASIITNKRKTSVINDPVIYKEISTIAYNIYLDTKPSIFWISDGQDLEFQNVKCEITSESGP